MNSVPRCLGLGRKKEGDSLTSSRSTSRANSLSSHDSSDQQQVRKDAPGAYKYTTSNVVTDTLQKAAVVREWFKCLNNHDLEAARTLITFEFVVVFQQDDSAQTMTWFEYRNECKSLFESLPDYTITLKGKMEAKDEVRPHGIDSVAVMARGVTSTGTHRGWPYAFGNDSDPIPTQGACVESEPATVHFYFQNDRICKVHVKCQQKGHGQIAGPAGIYTKLGGLPPV